MRISDRIREAASRNELAKIVTAVAAQGMLSLSNFVIGILMAKYAAKTEYGVYVILFSIIGVFGAYQNAVINAPLMVLVGNKKSDEKKAYLSSLAVGKYYVFVPLLLVITVVYVLYSFINHEPGHYAVQALALSVVSVIFLSKEFNRTLHFVAMNTNAIFRMDLLNVAATLVGMVLLVYIGAMSSLTAIAVLGAGYFAAYGYSKRMSSYYSHERGRDIRKALRENWRYGKWAMVGVTSSLIQDRGYIYIVTVLLGLGALADISAARLFLMPIALLNLSSAKIVVAKGSKMLSMQRNGEFRRFLFFFLSVLSIIWLVYFSFVMLASNWIIGFLGEKYAHTGNLILLWGFFFLVHTIRFMLGTGLAVYRQFRKIASFDVWGASLAIVACYLLASAYGAAGAVISLMAGEFLTMVLYLRMYLRLKADKEVAPEIGAAEIN